MPEEQGKKGAGAVQKSAQAAHAVHGAIKTGKAVAGAAKGAAVGGPYGAAAAALWARLAQEAPFAVLCFQNQSVLTQWGMVSGLTPTQQNPFYGFAHWSVGSGG